MGTPGRTPHPRVGRRIVRRSRALAAGLVVAVAVAWTPAGADDQEYHPLEAVAPAPLAPPPPAGLLRRAIPTVEDALRGQPPFLRDTALTLHVRTFYFDREKADGTESEAWAIGGWLAFQSGWLLDTFAVGATGYTSQPLYAPDDKDGTFLLAPGQEGIRT